MYAIYGNIYHQYTPNVSIYTIHGSYGYGMMVPDDFQIGCQVLLPVDLERLRLWPWRGGHSNGDVGMELAEGKSL
jgi:hypothetical protein